MVINAVASLAEAWIEIFSGLASGERVNVASLAEAWIEIVMTICEVGSGRGRLPRGGVD